MHKQWIFTVYHRELLICSVSCNSRQESEKIYIMYMHIYIYEHAYISEYMCIHTQYIWIILLYTWNIVNQVYFNKKYVKVAFLLGLTFRDVPKLLTWHLWSIFICGHQVQYREFSIVFKYLRENSVYYKAMRLCGVSGRVILKRRVKCKL